MDTIRDRNEKVLLELMAQIELNKELSLDVKHNLVKAVAKELANL